MTGNGTMLRLASSAAGQKNASQPGPVADLAVFSAGIATVGVFFVLGKLAQNFVPGIHAYAWMVLLMVLLKGIGLVPIYLEKSCGLWFQFFAKNLTTVLLAGLGIGLISLQPVVDALTPVYILLVVASLLGAIIGSGLVGWFMGFYPIEAAITSGLCLTNMGGVSDVITLSACKRMGLMPFASVASRLGGALILLLGGILLPLLD
jgi:Na+/citrate or Na+/malate symporter